MKCTISLNSRRLLISKNKEPIRALEPLEAMHSAYHHKHDLNKQNKYIDMQKTSTASRSETRTIFSADFRVRDWSLPAGQHNIQLNRSFAKQRSSRAVKVIKIRQPYCFQTVPIVICLPPCKNRRFGLSLSNKTELCATMEPDRDQCKFSSCIIIIIILAYKVLADVCFEPSKSQHENRSEKRCTMVSTVLNRLISRHHDGSNMASRHLNVIAGNICII